MYQFYNKSKLTLTANKTLQPTEFFNDFLATIFLITHIFCLRSDNGYMIHQL
jgi:hypothetical protein